MEELEEQKKELIQQVTTLKRAAEQYEKISQLATMLQESHRLIQFFIRTFFWHRQSRSQKSAMGGGCYWGLGPKKVLYVELERFLHQNSSEDQKKSSPKIGTAFA